MIAINNPLPSEAYIDSILESVKPILKTHMNLKDVIIDSIYYDYSNKSYIYFKSDHPEFSMIFDRYTYIISLSIYQLPKTFNFNVHFNKIMCCIGLNLGNFDFSYLSYVFEVNYQSFIYFFDKNKLLFGHTHFTGNSINRNYSYIQNNINHDNFVDQLFLDKLLILRKKEWVKDLFPEYYQVGVYNLNNTDFTDRQTLFDIMCIN